MRNDVTEEYYPDKITIEEFFEEILFDKDNVKNFHENMTALSVEKEQYPEDWAHMFIAWMELNK